MPAKHAFSALVADCPTTHGAQDRITRMLLSNTSVRWWAIGLTLYGSEQGKFAGYPLERWTVVLKRAPCELVAWLLVGPSASGHGNGVYTVRPVALGETVFDPHDMMPAHVRMVAQPRRGGDADTANLQREQNGAMRSLKALPAINWTARSLADVRRSELLL